MATEQILITRIRRSRWQPRGQAFDEDALWELACSIKENGLINAIKVFAVEDGYELIAGERRLRASMGMEWGREDVVTPKEAVQRLAREGLDALPDEVRADLRAWIRADVEPATDLERLHRMAVVENLERESLSTLEEAAALKGLADAYGWSQREVARRIGKSQSYVAQRFGLLDLSDETKAAVSTRVLTTTHARAISKVPKVLQPAVTEWAKAAVGKEDTPATTRQVQNRARQVAAFVESERWLPEEDEVYRPYERNRRALVRWALDQNLEGRGDALVELAAVGRYSPDNYLAKKVDQQIRSDYVFELILTALLGAGTTLRTAWKTFAEQDERTCATCVLSEIETVERDGMAVYCPRWMGTHQSDTCERWIGEDEPLIIPLFRELMAWFGELEIEHEQRPFPYVMAVGPYVAGIALAVDGRRKAKAAREQKEATKHIAEIQAFADWQSQQPEERMAHFQSHTCAKCVNFRDGDDGPCRFVLEPLPVRSGKDRLQAPAFGLLVDAEGGMYPRCEQFAYADVPQIHCHEGMKFAKRTQAVEWLHRMSMGGAFGNPHSVLFGVLRWLDYGRALSQTTELDKIKWWVRRNWDALGGDGGVATLIDVAMSESKMRAANRQPYTLLDPTTNEKTKFAAVNWGALTGDHFSTWGYPSKWPCPWESGGDDDGDG